MSDFLPTNSIVHSRRGDQFHYRWAARQCLKLLDNTSNLEGLIIEGSQKYRLQGEDVIDVELSYKNGDAEYYQLKHSSTQTPYTLSDHKKTIQGFAKRYKDLKGNERENVHFILLSNRRFADSFKKIVEDIAQGNKTNETFKKYTTILNDTERQEFCNRLHLERVGEDYLGQKEKLAWELGLLMPDRSHEKVINLIDKLIEVILNGDKEIKKKPDILAWLGITRQSDLFPAPNLFEEIPNLLQRDCYANIQIQITNEQSLKPIIIEATGGVGKSVFCRYFLNQFIEKLPNNSIGIVFDSFAAGKYQNTSQQRHGFKDNVLQIINELSEFGLCDLLILPAAEDKKGLMNIFLGRLKTAIERLKQLNPDAQLYILIDAADNAAMAAEQSNETCFAKEVLQEELPKGCKLILLCRPERKELLKPSYSNRVITLPSFDETESESHLKKFFPDSTVNEIRDFHSLTNGNPRLQAEVLDESKSIEDVWNSIQLGGNTIESQLDYRINKIKETHTDKVSNQVDKLGYGLANLNPFIPIEVLSQITGITIDEIKSITSDIGRALYINEGAIQFRDEPTETWFRNTYDIQNKECLNLYISGLEKICCEVNSQDDIYASKSLPQLLYAAKKYDPLIELCLSQNNLPKDELDRKAINLYRLKFGLKAALKQQDYVSAYKISLLTGQEIASDERQKNIIQANTDLAAQFYSEQLLYELTNQMIFKEAWNGASCLYKASLLSYIPNYHAEARSYKAIGNELLKADRKKAEEDDFYKITDNDYLEILNLEALNIAYQLGQENYLIEKIDQFNLDQLHVIQDFIGRLLDKEDYEAIYKIAKEGKSNPAIILPITTKLLKVGRFLPEDILIACLPQVKKSNIIEELNELDIHNYEKPCYRNYLVSFIEACCKIGISKIQLLQLVELINTKSIDKLDGKYLENERDLYLRIYCLKHSMKGEEATYTKIEEELKHNLKNQGTKDYKLKEIQENTDSTIGVLFPWYKLRFESLIGNISDFDTAFQSASEESSRRQKSYKNKYINTETQKVRINSLIFCNQVSERTRKFIEGIQVSNIKNAANQVWIFSRVEHLKTYYPQLEEKCRTTIENNDYKEGSEKSEDYIKLCRAILSIAKEDSQHYFTKAIEFANKSEDELFAKWAVITATAKKYIETNPADNPKLAYRFLRCAEYLGDFSQREKYWDREEAMCFAYKLSPKSAFSLLSRWENRGIIHLGRVLPALIKECIQNEHFSAASLWAFCAYNWDYGYSDALELFLSKEPSNSKRELAWTEYIKRLRQTEEITNNENTYKTWANLAGLANKFNLPKTETDKVLKYLDSFEKEKGEEITFTPNQNKEDGIKSEIWASIFAEIDFTKQEDIDKAYEQYKIEEDKIREEGIYLGGFFEHVIKQIPRNETINCLKIILSSKYIQHFEIKGLIENLPANFKGISTQTWLKDEFPSLYGFRFSKKITTNWLDHEHSLRGYISYLSTENEFSKIRQGIYESILENSNIDDTFFAFGLCKMLIEEIPSSNLAELLNLAIENYETDISAKYAEGEWNLGAMNPPDNYIDSMTGFIWSMIGSPYAERRWESINVVRNMALFDCISELDSLIEWCKHDKTKHSFNLLKYPYLLTAKLYLHIALYRISLEKPEILQKHSDYFKQTALQTEHISIQWFAAQICCHIENQYQGTFNTKDIEAIQFVGKGDISAKHYKRSKGRKSPYSENKEEIHINSKFEEEWLNRLPFDMLREEIRQQFYEILLQNRLAFEDIKSIEKYVKECREITTKDFSHMIRESHPTTESTEFYLLYHSLMELASKLIQTTQITEGDEFGNYSWKEWLNKQLITHPSGKWLSEYRSKLPLNDKFYAPLNRYDAEWLITFNTEDFMNVLIQEKDGQYWFNVAGSYFRGNDDNNSERCSFNTAWVSKEGANSLLNGLLSARSPMDYRIPEYTDEQYNHNDYPFIFQGWTFRPEQYYPEGLDALYSENQSFKNPPIEIGDKYKQQFNLKFNQNTNRWYQNEEYNPVMIYGYWATTKEESNLPSYAGQLLSASLNFLKDLCKKQQMNLLIEVHISRFQSRNTRDYENDKYPDYKLFLLDENGNLTDATKSYQIGKPID